MISYTRLLRTQDSPLSLQKMLNLFSVETRRSSDGLVFSKMSTWISSKYNTNLQGNEILLCRVNPLMYKNESNEEKLKNRLGNVT